MEKIAIVWLRRDLRITDHPALSAAALSCERVVPLFVLDPRLLEGRFASGPRSAFMLDCLRALATELEQIGGGLCVRSGNPEEVVPQLAQQLGASEVYWTSDVSPYARRRDGAISETLTAAGVQAVPSPGNYCADISVPRTSTGKPFGVFTPFWKAQRELPRRPVLAAPTQLRLPDGLELGSLPEWPPLTEQLEAPFCEPGEPAARLALEKYLNGPVDHYAEQHDNLSGGTSGLSPWIRWGCLSTREVEQRALDRGSEGARAFVRQLTWRDFYGHVLLCFPDNLKLEYQPRYRNLEWDEDEQLLEAWTRGKTGYPLVDAGMRRTR